MGNATATVATTLGATGCVDVFVVNNGVGSIAAMTEGGEDCAMDKKE